MQLGKLQAKHKSDHKCKTCSRPRNSPDQPCPGLKCTECHTCKKAGHFIGAPVCPGPSNASKSGAEKSDQMKKVRKVASDTEESSDLRTLALRPLAWSA